MRILDGLAEKLVAYNEMYAPLNKITRRIERRYRKLGHEIYERLVERQNISKNSPISLSLTWQDSLLARGYKLGVEEFKQKFPEYGLILQEMINTHRKCRRNYIQFGLKPQAELPESIYIDVLKDIGLSTKEARKVYKTIKDIGARLETKKQQGLTKLLIKE